MLSVSPRRSTPEVAKARLRQNLASLPPRPRVRALRPAEGSDVASPSTSRAHHAHRVRCAASSSVAMHPPPPPPPQNRGPTARASVSASASATTPPILYTEADFTVSDRNRDPFRGYLELFHGPSSRAKSTIEQKIVAENYSLDELKLVAIVSGGTTPRAMLVDPNHKGHIVTRGELIGRTETIRSSGQGSSEYDVTWKVERIREGDVILFRFPSPRLGFSHLDPRDCASPRGRQSRSTTLIRSARCSFALNERPARFASSAATPCDQRFEARARWLDRLGRDAHASGAPFLLLTVIPHRANPFAAGEASTVLAQWTDDGGFTAVWFSRSAFARRVRACPLSGVRRCSGCWASTRRDERTQQQATATADASAACTMFLSAQSSANRSWCEAFR